jgi:catechol 2,3-dioxygenase-like lactoylglutathione lyase family enzyme
MQKKTTPIKYKGSNVTLMVSSMAKSKKFYTEVVGLKLSVDFGSHWAELTAPGITIGLHPRGKKIFTTGTAIAIGFETDDIHSAADKLREKGIELEVINTGHVRQAYFSDLDGNALYLFQYPKKKAK